MPRKSSGRPYQPGSPEEDVDDFFHCIPAYIHAYKGRTFTFNTKGAHSFTTWRWIALRVPEGVAQVLWLRDPRSSPYYGVDFTTIMKGGPRQDPPQPPGIIFSVRRMLQRLAEHAKYLQRSQDGEIIHRAKIVHPDLTTEEEFDVVLIDLLRRGIHLDRYLELFFHGALEIRDLMNGAPLVYGGVPRLTPPGARSLDRLLRAQITNPDAKEAP